MKLKILLFGGSIMLAQSAESPKNSSLAVITSITVKNNKESKKDIFNPKWVDSLQLALPCKNIKVPKQSGYLPNAPRDNRSGIHRGVDFLANWGTAVHAVANGVVVRADHGYMEVPASFRVNMLEASRKVGSTPSDIFNNVLLGQAIFIDHGFGLVPGFRTITIYAHLSHIEKNIKPGVKVSENEVIGKSGNTGMKASTLGTKKQSHLHWEMILQNKQHEIYLGQGIPNPELYEMLNRIFN